MSRVNNRTSPCCGGNEGDIHSMCFRNRWHAGMHLCAPSFAAGAVSLKLLFKARVYEAEAADITARAMAKGVTVAADLVKLSRDAIASKGGTLVYGPPPSPTNQPSYERLGVPVGSPEQLVKRAYHKQARRHHPDRGGNPAEFVLTKAAFDQIMGERAMPRAPCEEAGIHAITLSVNGGALIPFLDEVTDTTATVLGPMMSALGEGTEEHENHIGPYAWLVQTNFVHPDEYRAWMRLAARFAAIRFSGDREGDLMPGDPLSAGEILGLQPNAFVSGGDITIFMQFDRTAGNTSREARKQSAGWNALCAAAGHDVDTQAFDRYVTAFATKTNRQRGAPMAGQKRIADVAFPEDAAGSTPKRIQAKFAREVTDSAALWVPKLGRFCQPVPYQRALAAAIKLATKPPAHRGANPMMLV